MHGFRDKTDCFLPNSVYALVFMPRRPLKSPWLRPKHYTERNYTIVVEKGNHGHQMA